MSEIIVFINEYKCYDGEAPVCLTPGQVVELITALNTVKKNPSGCFDTFDIEMQNQLCGSQYNPNNTCIGKLEIDTGRDSMDLIDLPLKHKRGLCPCNGRLWTCNKMLALGKCKDEFMRNTIGAVLYPQFYNNSKGK